jgi:hypothetical protein
LLSQLLSLKRSALRGTICLREASVKSFVSIPAIGSADRARLTRLRLNWPLYESTNPLRDIAFHDWSILRACCTIGKAPLIRLEATHGHVRRTHRHTFMFNQNSLNTWPNAFAVLECFHIAGFALAIGMIALVDFSLLGFIMLKQSPVQIARAFEWWTMGGLIVAVVSGLLIFSTDPDMYYLNRSFLLKMAALVLAIVYNYTIHRQALFKDLSPASTGLIACLSLLLWVSVIFGGIFIAVIPAGLV